MQNFNRGSFWKETMPVWTEMITRWRMERGGPVQRAVRETGKEAEFLWDGKISKCTSIEKCYWAVLSWHWLKLRTDFIYWAGCHLLSPRDMVLRFAGWSPLTWNSLGLPLTYHSTSFGQSKTPLCLSIDPADDFILLFSDSLEFIWEPPGATLFHFILILAQG